MNRFIIRLIVMLFTLLELCACSSQSPRSVTAQQNLNAAQVQATNAALDEQAATASAAEEQRKNNDAAARSTEQARNATAQAVNATEEARQAIARVTEQARTDQQAQLTLEQQQVAATATRSALDRQMNLDAQSATRTAVEYQATITAAQSAAASIQKSSTMQNDWYYLLPEVLMRYAPCGVVLFALMLIGYVVRAIAARIAGDEGRAKMALANPSLTLYFPTALLPAPRYDDDENETETGNTATPENSENNGETGGETPDLMTLGYAGEQRLAPRMSREEYHELLNIRQEAIALLDRCVKYYRDNQSSDDGTIPRYDKIHMKSEDRGRIVDNIWYSGYVIKSPNRTAIDPAYYTTCAALMKAIIDKQARIYPLGYLERKQQRLDDAVAALPANKREQYAT